MLYIENPEVTKIFNSYPEPFKQQLLKLRALVIETAQETKEVNAIEECLKWGEPSYLSKQGSTLRMDWKQSKPEQYALYFNCNTKLIDTFKELYGDLLKFEGNRAIIFYKEEKIPVDEIKHCITLALTYHKIKHLPLLGA